MMTSMIYGFTLNETIETNITDGEWEMKTIINEIKAKPPHNFKAEVDSNEELSGWRQKQKDSQGNVIGRSSFSRVQFWQGETKAKVYRDFKRTINRWNKSLVRKTI
jgi:hypothetical protein